MEFQFLRDRANSLAGASTAAVGDAVAARRRGGLRLRAARTQDDCDQIFTLIIQEGFSCYAHEWIQGGAGSRREVRI